MDRQGSARAIRRLARGFERDLENLAKTHRERLFDCAQAWLNSHKGPVAEIVMTMGVIAFYGHDGVGIHQHDIPKRAQPLIDFAYAYVEVFGTPDFHISKRSDSNKD